MKVQLKLGIKFYNRTVLLPFAKHMNMNKKGGRNNLGSKISNPRKSGDSDNGRTQTVMVAYGDRKTG